jgi:pyruvate/2-oxoglutarate dehydrogenase complex dihydrolipoamide acyltransferase (E2) component
MGSPLLTADETNCATEQTGSVSIPRPLSRLTRAMNKEETSIMKTVRHLSTLMALGALIALSACGGGNEGNTQAAVTPAAAPPPPAPAAAAPPPAPAPAPPATGAMARPHAVSPGQIRAVQSVLRHAGEYHLAVDGRQGPATTRAVRRWQRDHGLRPTGIIDPATMQTMNIH